MGIFNWILDKLSLLSPNQYFGLFCGLTSIFLAYCISDEPYAVWVALGSVAVTLSVFFETLTTKREVTVIIGIWASYYTIPLLTEVISGLFATTESSNCILEKIGTNSTRYGLPNVDECADGLTQWLNSE